MLQLARLKVLVELNRRKTLTAVAKALSYSTSAVSQQLQQLEAEAGVPLLEPAGRGVRLTPQALILVRHAEDILSRLEQAESEVAASLNEVRGMIKVAAFQTAALMLVPEMLVELAASHPQIEVEITQGEPGETLPGLASGLFDLVIGEEFPGFPVPPAQGIEFHELHIDPLWVVMSAEHAAGIDRDINIIAQLGHLDWAMEPADTPPRLWVTSQCRKAGFEPRVICTSEDLMVHRRLVETGLAVAVLPELALSGAGPGLHRFPITEALQYRRIVTAARTGARQHPTIAAVRNALRTVIAGIRSA